MFGKDEPFLLRKKDPEQGLWSRDRTTTQVGDTGDQDVALAQEFIRNSEPRIGNIGDPDLALTEEQLGWSVEDSQYRLRLIEESGGSESAFEGIVISEETDPAVQGMVIAFKARQMAEDGVRALEAYQASWEIRLGHRIYQWRLRVTERLQEFYAWLRRTE